MRRTTSTRSRASRAGMMPCNAFTSSGLQVRRAIAPSTKLLASSNALMASSFFTAFVADLSSALEVADEEPTGGGSGGICAIELGQIPLKARETSWRSCVGSNELAHCSGADIGARACSSRVSTCSNPRSSRAFTRACQTALPATARIGSASQVNSRDTFQYGAGDGASSLRVERIVTGSWARCRMKRRPQAGYSRLRSSSGIRAMRPR
jgi:hypothetical protein